MRTKFILPLILASFPGCFGEETVKVENAIHGNVSNPKTRKILEEVSARIMPVENERSPTGILYHLDLGVARGIRGIYDSKGNVTREVDFIPLQGIVSNPYYPAAACLGDFDEDGNLDAMVALWNNDAGVWKNWTFYSAQHGFERSFEQEMEFSSGEDLEPVLDTWRNSDRVFQVYDFRREAEVENAKLISK